MGLAATQHDKVRDALNEAVRLMDFPSTSRSNELRKRVKQAEERGFDPWDEPIRLIHAFFGCYYGDSQLRVGDPQRLSRHAESLADLRGILRPVGQFGVNAEEDWKILKAVESQLTSFLDKDAAFGPLSPQLLANARQITVKLLCRAKSLRADLHAIHESLLGVEDEVGDRSRFDRAMARLEKALEELQIEQIAHDAIEAAVGDLDQLWEKFRSEYMRLTVARKFRPTLQELNRLAIHSEQEAIVQRDYDKWRRIEGVSGSGKTIVLLHRALRLAAANPRNQVRVFTINRALAQLLETTVAAITGNKGPVNLSISSFYDFLLSCVSLCDDVAKYRLCDDRSGERLPASWSDFLNHSSTNPDANIFAQKDVKRLVGTLQQRLTMSRSDVGDYLHDEMIYVQSAYRRCQRSQYMNDPRVGRKVKLKRAERSTCLAILGAWEEYLGTGHLWGVHSLALVAAEFFADDGQRNRIRESFPTHHVLIDEYQDFSTLELEMLRRLSLHPEGMNAFFFAGDMNQKVYAKQLRTRSAGFNFQGRSEILCTNYRNTKQILRAASHISAAFPPESEDATEKYQFRLSPYEGTRPVVLNCTLSNQCSYIQRIIEHRRGCRVGVVSENGQLLAEVMRWARECGHAPQEILRNEEIDCWNQQDQNLFSAHLVFGRFEAVKGFEFDTLIAADLSAGVVPRPGVPKEEYWRAAAAVYGAITRARDELIITWSGKPSTFLLKIVETSGEPTIDGYRMPDDDLLSEYLRLPKVNRR